MNDPPPTAPLPEHVGGGRYRVTGHLGTGGMGSVVRAHDELLHRDVAVKLLADEVEADPAARERFLREARSAASIHDPRVVSVYDVGDEDGRAYLVMECVDGPSLADVLADRGALPAEDVIDVAVDALAGLARAHEAGLLHRDIKPANLLRAPDGTVKVTDFGVAEATDSAALTRTGFVVGTMNYLAPERRAGAPATVATDLWAMGATLLELLTGRGPSTENRPDTLPDDVPADLVALLGTLLADDPGRRPSSAIEALSRLAGGGDPGPLTSSTTAVPPPRHLTTALPQPGPDTPHGEPAPTVAAEPTTALDRAGAEPGPVADVPEATDTAADATDRTRWAQVAVAGLALLLVVVLVSVLTGDPGPDVAETGVDVSVDPDDPAGTLRDLAEQLRRRADG